MAMVQAAMSDIMKHAFSPMAILTGGASLPITSAKSLNASMNAPAAGAAAPQPVAAPQTSKTPDRAGVGGTASVGAGAASGGTFLTGPAGVDSSALNLGRNTLLGQ